MSAGSFLIDNQEFHQLRTEISRLFSETEFVLEEREQILHVDDTIEDKLTHLLNLIAEKLKLLHTALTQQKNTPEKYEDLVTKESLKNVMIERLTMLKTKRDGGYVDEKKYQDNREMLEKLEDDLIINKHVKDQQTNKMREEQAQTANYDNCEDLKTLKANDPVVKEELCKVNNPEKKKYGSGLMMWFMILFCIVLIAVTFILNTARNMDNEHEEQSL